MVKLDAKRDYYADLELPPTADAEEIKKQFRTLGILSSWSPLRIWLTEYSEAISPRSQPRARGGSTGEISRRTTCS